MFKVGGTELPPAEFATCAGKRPDCKDLHSRITIPSGLFLAGVAMPKNIVLCADGTGNSSGALFTTNVWRLYQALDVADPERQVAYYHDGVGTSSFRPLALVTGAFGYGLARNVREIYEFLCRNYEDGDRIFGFGFSRGAFTIRILMGLVATQGIVPYSGDEAKLSADALGAYRNFRKLFHTNFHVEERVRRPRDWFLRVRGKQFDPTLQRHAAWIHFIGVWDTVDAYGGPIDEISDGIDYWLFPLSLRNLWLSAKVRRACQALALDEERQAFWPRLWNDKFVEGPTGVYHPMQEQEGWMPISDDEMAKIDAPLRPSLHPLRNIDRQRLSQVWFAGVHSDVGGGYSKAGLSYVTLDWMMDRALAYGLHIKVKAEQDLRACVNAFDEMNDSRRGFGVYYRYQPRRHETLYGRARTALCVEAWDKIQGLFHVAPRQGRKPEHADPIVHESVFDRIDADVNPYAPIVLREHYHIARRDGRIERGPFRGKAAGVPVGGRVSGGTVADAGGGVPLDQRIWNLVWFRRVIYYVTLLATIALVAIPPAVHYGCPGHYWCPAHSPAHWASWFVPVIHFVGAVVPDFAKKYWTDFAEKTPEYVLLLVAIILLFLMPMSTRLKTSIANSMGYIWESRLGRLTPNQQPWPASWPANTRWVYWLRTRDWYRNFFEALRWCVLPTLAVWIPVFLIADGLTYLIGDRLMGIPLPGVRCVINWIMVVFVAVQVLINIGIAARGAPAQEGHANP